MSTTGNNPYYWSTPAVPTTTANITWTTTTGNSSVYGTGAQWMTIPYSTPHDPKPKDKGDGDALERLRGLRSGR